MSQERNRQYYLALRNYKLKQQHLQNWFKYEYDPTNKNEIDEYQKWRKSWKNFNLNKNQNQSK
jgi:hypothetical protein